MCRATRKSGAGRRVERYGAGPRALVPSESRGAGGCGDLGSPVAVAKNKSCPAPRTSTARSIRESIDAALEHEAPVRVAAEPVAR